MCAVKIGRLGKFDLNPRGELWSKDENRFGHKLLSKFGWSKGKGLGKNEDGVAENLKVKKRMRNTGIGWDEKLAIGIDYQEYDAVLEDLNKRYQKPGEVNNEEISLEKRSQLFKNRIHYQKFVRGKDISRYSEKDMSCIFLSREPEKEIESTPKETTVTNIESRPVDHAAKESGPTFNSQLSIADYFAMKMKNKMGSSLNTPKESKTCEESFQSETDTKSKKRKHEFKSSKKAKRMKYEPGLGTAEGSLSYEEGNTSESPSSSQKAPEEILISKEQFQNVEECYSEIGRAKRRLKKKARKLLNALKSKQDIKNNQQEENNVAEKKSTETKSLEEQSQEGSSNSTEESIDMTEKEVMSKKRKKEHKSCKKAKKRHLEEAEISTSVEKNSSHSESDDEGKNSSEVCITESVKTEKQSHKESKKRKNKIFNFKSCLKSCLSNDKYSFKEKRKVSFCENISYKIIENVVNNFDSDVVLETNEQLLSCSDEDCTDSEVPNETENIGMNHVDDSDSSGKSSNGDVQCGGEDVPCQEDSDVFEDNTVPECFKLPKCSSANYDSWLETQRIAARMKVYKNMVKKMKKHPVLRKTNLLEIKGYGNWGL